MSDEGQVKKKQSPIEKYFYAGKSEEEIKAWRAESVAKAIATKGKKKQEIAEARQKAREMLPQILAEDMLLLDSDNYTPRPEVIEKIRKLLEAPTMTLERLRRENFRTMSEKGWEKLTKFLFKDHVANTEDLGLQIIEQREKEVKRLEKTVRMLRKEIKLAKKESWEKYKSKRAPIGLLELLIEAEKELRTYKLDVHKNIYKTNLESNKSKGSTSIHIHSTVPRPPAEQVRDITPKVTLDELVNGD